MDGGAQTSTCHLRYLIHKFEVIKVDKRLYDAGNHPHKAEGQGYLKVVASRTSDNEDHFSMFRVWFTPTLPSIIIFPGEIVRRHPSRFVAYSSYSNPSKKTGHVRLMGIDTASDLYLPGRTKQMLLWSLPLVPAPATAGLRINSLTGYDDGVKISYMSDRATRILWHQRLNHAHFRRVSQMHKHVDGVPKIKEPQDTDGCSTCWACKMRYAYKGCRDTRDDATVVGQGIGLDFGFIVQRSKNKDRYDKMCGINGETAYLLLVDHCPDHLWGVATDGKAPPLTWLNRWLTQYRPAAVPHRYAVMDNGGELSNNGEVLQLLEYHTYTPRPTAPDSSHQNGSVENPHQYIAATLRSMLHGAGIADNLWPYSFYHFLLVHKLLPQGTRGAPFLRVTGKRGDVARLRVFGCYCLVRPLANVVPSFQTMSL
jgi:hypothetical protein